MLIKILRIKKIKIFLTAALLAISTFACASAEVVSQNVNLDDNSFAVSYNLADDKLVSDVKDQGQRGNCWAFAVMGALESNYLKNKENLKNILGDNPDLSELHAAWFAFYNPDASLAFAYIDDNGEISPDVMPVYMLEGGENNNLKAAALFARLDGPVLNTDLAYPEAGQYALPWRPEEIESVPDMSSPDKIYSLVVNGTSRKYGAAFYTPHKEKKPSDYTPALRVTSVLMNSGDESGVKDFIKTMITENGAVAAAIDLYSGGFYSGNDDNYMTYFSDGLSNKLCEHNILITGWDDSFSRDNFRGSKPEGNGAWLVQNSWGEQWGNNGYFWLSYEEPLKNPAAFVVEPYNANIRHYGNDALGFNGRIYITDGDVSSAWMASALRIAGDHEKLREIGFFTPEPDMSYQIYVYKHGNISSITSPVAKENLVAVNGGDCEFAGYHVVKLSQSVPLEKGCLFSIVIQLSSENNNVPLAVATKIAGTKTANAVINEGESFFSLNGTDWTDGTKIASIIKSSSPEDITAADACIKAFTFIPEQKRAEDWLIYRDGDKAELQLAIFRETAPQNVLVYGSGINNLKWATALEKGTTTGAVNSAALTGNFYLLKVSGTVTDNDTAAITLISIDDSTLEMPEDGVKLSSMTATETNPNKNNDNTSSKTSSIRNGCNSGFKFNFISIIAVLFLIFARMKSAGDK